MAESAGLGDFGDAGGDEPGFVAVAEFVEGQAGPDGVGADGGMGEDEVAVEGGVEHAGAPVVAPEEATVVVREHDGVVVAGEVVFEQDGQERGQGDGAGAGGCFGRSEPLAVGGFLERADVGIDDDDAVVEMGVVALQAGEFAPSAAGPRGGDDQDGAGAAVESFGLLGTARTSSGVAQSFSRRMRKARLPRLWW